MGRRSGIFSILWTTTLVLVACSTDNSTVPEDREVPHDAPWGIYSLEVESGDVSLVYSSSAMLSGLFLSPSVEGFVFSERVGCDADSCEEICSVNSDGSGFRQLTDNDSMDTYPCWSPDGSEIAYLSFGSGTLDIYVMNEDGSDAHLLYDSGGHDADINWVGDRIVFTRNSQIWMMESDGSYDHQITNPPRAGEWGNANLPFGDYDPRLSPNGSTILFSRLVDDASQHGNYDFYAIGRDGSNEHALTNNGYTQGLSQWSRSGDQIVFVVAAIDDVGMYDLYLMDADGSNSHSITPAYFPETFLCRSATFSVDGRTIYFIGQWFDQS